MAVVRRTRSKNGKTYLEYHYWKDGRVITIYCGIEGDAGTQEKVNAAKQEHRAWKMSRLADV